MDTNLKVPFNNLHAQYMSIKDEVDEAISRVINNSSFIKGENVERFEQEFSKIFNVNNCISCANGTDAIYIALKGLNVKPGDEVIVPANSWISTSETVSQAGAKIIFCDIDKDTFTIKMSDENITKIYQMALIEIDTDVLKIPNVDYTADIEIVSNSCKNYVNELSLFGEELTFMCNQENVILKSSGEGNSSVIIIKDECLEVYAIEEDADISCKYDIKLIKSITNFVKLSQTIHIGISTTMPLAMVYKLDDNDENTLKFYIAPKIEDEY